MANETNIEYLDPDGLVTTFELIHEEIVSETSLTATSASPLSKTAKANILGIHAKGKSEQITTQTLATVQGNMPSTAVGDKINATVVSTHGARCCSNIVYLSANASINITSGYEVFTMYSTSADGNIITNSGGWEASKVVDKDGYYRFQIRKSDNSTITPTSFTLTASGMSPTPTSPIPIIDASGDVTAHTINLCNVDDIVLGKSWNDTTNASRGYVEITDVVVGETYTLSAENINGLSSISAMPMSGTELVGSAKTVDANTSSVSFAIANTVDKIRILFVAPSGTLTKAMAEGTKTMFCKGTSKSYVPHQSNSVYLPFSPKSVGSVANELIVNEDGSAKIVQRVGTVNLASLNWSYDSANQRFLALESTHKQTSRMTQLLCSCYSCKSNNEAFDVNWDNVIYSGNINLIIHDKRFTDASELKSSLTNVECYTELATPIETPLTAEEVASIRQLQTYKGTTVIESEMQIDSVTYFVNSPIGAAIGILNNSIENVGKILANLGLADEEEF